ncbi:aminotransferase class I/II-fold pyridoxal phosphate-dependent enzyme [Arthrobacter sp. CAU 1506]|uniref:aminotransferase class I/II-fold pyridoxal phosphate-dependent enzyme n=1 Tax=Arthrobacter sp. CAU 1506 TaxID=2560052 RepID=UPI0010AC734B|nr:aminotransferase class I/II-fold pyridoxal phosphate-dependent enzyme [Arthrobacter sp. CAU 1506]TJY66218.1 aminotransferase class I/II-fold pyridoxal phosphate-dependent enzyme [Arthrobacter sp. CAU 1506]
MSSIVLSGPQSTRITDVKGRGLLNFASNDYLQLANHPDIVDAGITCLRSSGAGMASVAFISGHHEAHSELEELTAQMLRAEATVLFSSCYSANVALFSALYGDGDLIISDSLNHASLIDGIRLSRSARAVFNHGDLQALRDLLSDRDRYGRCVIVSDTVFSMEGDYVDLEALVGLAAEFDCDLVLDHSHLIGTEPSDGVGKFTWTPLPNTHVLITGTYGKALGGSAGGFIAGSEAAIETLRQKARPYIFSNLMPPALASIAAEAIRVMGRESWRVERLHHNVMMFSSLAASLGISVSESHRHPIIPLHGPDDAAVLRASGMLQERDIHAVAVTYPVVPRGEGRIRVQLTTGHSQEDMALLLSTWRECI